MQVCWKHILLFFFYLKCFYLTFILERCFIEYNTHCWHGSSTPISALLNISCHCLLEFIFSCENSVYIQLGVPIEIICHFCLSGFCIISLFLVFSSLTDLCLRVLFFFNLLKFAVLFESAKKNFFQIWEIFVRFFSLHSPCGTLVMCLLDLLILPQELFFLFSEYFFCFSDRFAFVFT